MSFQTTCLECHQIETSSLSLNFNRALLLFQRGCITCLQMAPKRSEKDGKKKEAQPPSGEWTHSKCSLNDLNKLASEGLLQDKSLVNWCPSFCEPFPMENVDEIVTFYHFAKRGLALPSCSFFRGLLYFYGLELHHLNPNSICHIAIFIHFCEAFLGIEPHWNLFRFLFRVKPQPTTKNLSIVGGAGIQLRQQAGDRYLSINSPPTFLDGRTTGSTSKIMLPNFQKNPANPQS
jgi:hypothetical protein